MEQRFKHFSDPVHGFIPVPHGLPLELVQAPEVQRLRRIRQLGVGYLVFPGAEHTRFGHALGAMALMGDALSNLSEKGTPVSPDERTAALAVALLHDVGHAPFSHTLENALIEDFHHEKMSRAMISGLNRRLGGALDLALRIFDNAYERTFFHHLISSQLDMDRLDYLRRDAFYTGVSEGIVGVQRIIKTMRVHPVSGGRGSELVIEAKGAYAVENFVISRRLMYWQVYLHKAVLSGDQLLKAILRRIRHHLQQRNRSLDLSPTLRFFLERRVTESDIADPDIQRHFTMLDDADVMYTLKRLEHDADPVLSDLCRRFLNRDFFRVTILERDPSPGDVEAWLEQAAEWARGRFPEISGDAGDVAGYYLAAGQSRHAAYETDATHAIRVLMRNGSVLDLSRVPEAAAIAGLPQVITKPYVCHPREIRLHTIV